MYAKKNSAKKIAAVLLAVVLLVGCTIGGTLAWLSAQSGPVTNTFTVGKIEIELKEHDLKDDGTLDTDAEVIENTDYKVVPGDTQPKDPFVRVKVESEKCYVYVCITNELVIGTDVVCEYNIDDFGWTRVATNGNQTLYRFNEIVDASAAAQTRQVFSEITYDGEKIDETNIASLAGKKIIIDAFAHQSDNTDLDTANEEALKHFEFPTN